MKKFLIVLLIIVAFSVYKKASVEDIVVIPDNSLRFRVISNSNKLADYKTKQKVKNQVEEKLFDLLKDVKSLDDTKKIIKDNLESIHEIVDSVTQPLNLKYTIDFGLNYFPKKVFKGVVYSEGNYDSLIITLGKGQGENWWCVLFPPLCLLEDNENTGDVEYQFFVNRIIERFK